MNDYAFPDLQLSENYKNGQLVLLLNTPHNSHILLTYSIMIHNIEVIAVIDSCNVYMHV